MTLPLVYKVTSGVKLIGIHGHAGSGKDTVADYLCQSSEIAETTFWESFAGPLKEACSQAFCIPADKFSQPGVKEVNDPFWGVSPRQIAQFVGTQLFRDVIESLIPGVGKDFWVQRMWGRLNNDLVPENTAPYELGDTVVISDVRFQNEYDFISLNKGIIIHLTRPGFDGTVGIPGHESELSINLHDKERTFECVNDSDLDSLFAKIDSILLQSSL
jgi:hypothetical protein